MISNWSDDYHKALAVRDVRKCGIGCGKAAGRALTHDCGLSGLAQQLMREGKKATGRTSSSGGPLRQAGVKVSGVSSRVDGVVDRDGRDVKGPPAE